MSVPFQKTVVVVDAMAFRRARVESFLNPWARNENVELISLHPEDAHSALVDRKCDMMIYNVGSALPSDHAILAEMQVLRTLHPETALVILSDDSNLEEIISAIHSGAQGYLSNSMAPDLALRALSFVLYGGTYFPPPVLEGHAVSVAPSMEGAHYNFSRDALRASPPPAPPKQTQMAFAAQGDAMLQQQASLFDERPAGVLPRDSSRLTERQQAVLLCLCQGDPNKVIGRKLGMTETTVKVHVREIMRKLGVCNRTQVAVAASRNGFDHVDEVAPLDSAAVKSSLPPH
jgi:DNA-binding NarL/FixJ family response regulator